MIGTLALARPKKRVFLGLMLVTEFLVALMLYGMWKITYLGLSDIYEKLPAMLGAAIITISIFSILSVFKILRFLSSPASSDRAKCLP